MGRGGDRGSGRETGLPSDGRRVALIVASAFFMQNLDAAILNTSMPQIASDFGVEPVAVNIGITAYVLSTAAFVPLSGWLADRFGAQRIFATAVVVFTAASLACGLAQGLWQLASMRALQGVGGALMTPVGRMVVLRSTEKSELLQATALITWPALIAPVIGPVLGGLITTYVSWRWNFLLNLPLGLAGLALVLAFVPNPRAQTPRPLDWVGFGFTAVAMMCLLGGLERLAHGGAAWLGSAGLILAGIGVAGAAGLHFRRREHPLLDLAPLRIPTFAVCSLDAGTLFRVAISATPFLLPLMFQIGFGLNPWQAGLLVLVYFAGNLSMKTVTTPLLQRHGFRTVLIANGVGVALSIGACAWLRPTTPWLAAALVLFAAGLTRSLQFTALNTLAFADVLPSQRGSSSTLASMFQQVGMGLGTAVAAFLLNASQTLRGGAALGLADFHAAFLCVAAVALVGTVAVARLQPDAGAEVSGHRHDAPSPRARAPLGARPRASASPGSGVLPASGSTRPDSPRG